MGGRGGASGVSGGKYGYGVNSQGQSYLSADKALFEGNTITVTRQIDTRTRGFDTGGNSALEATSDGNGKISLNYASAVSYDERNSRTTDAKYEIKTGIAIKGRNVESTGIDWDKVSTISGKTYGIGDLIKPMGFKWDGVEKVWRKK
jgi:hypothetical protein